MRSYCIVVERKNRLYELMFFYTGNFLGDEDEIYPIVDDVERLYCTVRGQSNVWRLPNYWPLVRGEDILARGEGVGGQ